MSSAAFEGWAVVELLGHRVRYGRVSEVTLFGEAFCKVEIPSEPPAIEFYAGKSLYGIRAASEASIRAYHAPRRQLGAGDRDSNGAVHDAPDEGEDIDVDEFDADTGGQHDDEPDDDEDAPTCGGCGEPIAGGEPVTDVAVDEGGTEQWHEHCAAAAAVLPDDLAGGEA